MSKFFPNIREKTMGEFVILPGKLWKTLKLLQETCGNNLKKLAENVKKKKKKILNKFILKIVRSFYSRISKKFESISMKL